MIGQLPPDFFNEFFDILSFKPEEAVAFQDKMHDLTQRRFLQQQLNTLPDFEKEAFNAIVEQDGVSASTVNDFLEERIEDDVRLALWEESMLFLWGEILHAIGDKATDTQKQQIKELVKKYR